MDKKSYSEQLKDPRWQKKRLEILERDNWTCTNCFSQDKTLHVHHKMYERGKAPYDYDNNMLTTLCDNCHNAAHRVINDMYGDFKDLVEQWYLCGFDNFEVSYLLFALNDAAIHFKDNEPEEVLSTLEGLENVCKYMQKRKENALFIEQEYQNHKLLKENK